MKSKFLFWGILSCFLIGCSGNSDMVTPVPDVFIPDVSNTWNSSRSSTFFFTADKTGVNTSNFVGQESSGAVADSLAGSFTNYNINFTFKKGTDAGVTYTGKFVKGSNPLQMQLKGTNGVSLTLTKAVSN